MKRPQFSLKYALIISGLAALAYMITMFSNQIANLQELSGQRDRMSLEATQLQATAYKLETQVAYATSDIAVRDWAMSEGQMIEPGVVPVFPIGPAARTPEPTPVRQVTPTALENWEMWLWLFVDRSVKAERAAP